MTSLPHDAQDASDEANDPTFRDKKRGARRPIMRCKKHGKKTYAQVDEWVYYILFINFVHITYCIVW